MRSENVLVTVFNAMFKDKHLWETITDEQKEKTFFIFNRYLSKKYPHQALYLNDKLINKSYGMDIWFYFMKTQKYPTWFWSKKENIIDKENHIFTVKEIQILKQKMDIKDSELNILIKYHLPELKEELKYFTKVSEI